LTTGGAYDPATDTWADISATDAPNGRVSPTAVWTGSKMIVWGGWGYSSTVGTGGVYDPAADAWTATSTTDAPSARASHTAVWAGSRMIVWGGGDGGGSVNTGGMYTPASDTWVATTTSGAPSGRASHTAVWTGSRMLVWGGTGVSYLNTGGTYDPGVPRFTLTVSTAGGTGAGAVTSSPTGIDCGSDCVETYDAGTVVTLTPSPGANSPFTSWSGDCTGSGACVVTMDADRSVAAAFTLNRYQLSVAKSGAGSGSVSSSPAGIDCGSDCSESYDHGTLVTLTPVPEVGSSFSSWSGDCTGSGACVVTMGGDRTVTATFAPSQHELTVTTDGAGSGSVSSSPEGIDCGSDCSELYDHGTEVTLTALADAGSTFASWSGDCTGSEFCVVTMDTAQSVTATFVPIEHTLTVSTGGTGSGNVTSSPAGIDCGLDCSESYTEGTQVTLTAARGIGSDFVGWSGACTGTGSCVVTMDAAKAVTATFDTGTGAGFYTLAPCRVVDTRSADGPALAAGSIRTFAVTGPLCGVPATARSVAVNVAVTNETQRGNLSLYPAGGAAPLSSTINFTPLLTRANNAVIGLGTDGRISVKCSMPAGSTQFVLDVTGYFE
jgi:hypothetical protein